MPECPSGWRAAELDPDPSDPPAPKGAVLARGSPCLWMSLFQVSVWVLWYLLCAEAMAGGR